MSDPKTAVITGSSSGIGLVMSQGLAGVGMKVVLNRIEPEAQIAPIRASGSITGSALPVDGGWTAQ